MPRTVVYALVGAVALGLVLFLALRGTGKAPTAAELTTKATSSGTTPADRERATLALAKKGPEGKESLKQLLKSSADPNVKASAALGLAELEAWDTMPLLLDALDDPAEVVRARAASAVAKLIGKDYGFKAAAPADERKRVAAAIRAEYKRMAASPPPRYTNPPSPSGGKP